MKQEVRAVVEPPGYLLGDTIDLFNRLALECKQVVFNRTQQKRAAQDDSLQWATADVTL